MHKYNVSWTESYVVKATITANSEAEAELLARELPESDTERAFDEYADWHVEQQK